MPENEYGLRCFWRKHPLEKGMVFRNLEGHPLCKDCAIEYLIDNYWEEEHDAEWAYNETINKFNGKYWRFQKWLEENHVICPEYNMWVEKDNFLEDYDMCQGCVESMECPMYYTCGASTAEMALKKRDALCTNGKYQECENHKKIVKNEDPILKSIFDVNELLWLENLEKQKKLEMDELHDETISELMNKYEKEEEDAENQKK